MSGTIKAWLSIGSTYTYLTALRLRSVVEASRIKLDIRPISIRRIMPHNSSKGLRIIFTQAHIYELYFSFRITMCGRRQNQKRK